MSIILRFEAQDRDWIMGEEFETEVMNNCRLDTLFKLISAEKKIAKKRFTILVPPDKRYRWANGKCKDLKGQERADWTVRRLGMFNKMVLQVNPTFPLAWLWHDMLWYEHSYIRLIKEAIDKTPEKVLTLQEIAKTVDKPPPIKDTLRVFLRKWPEHFQLEMNQNANMLRVRVQGNIKYRPMVV